MPKIAVDKFLTFFIYAYDALHEPPHMHVVKERGSRQRSAKIWLEPLAVADTGSLTPREISRALKVIAANREGLIDSFTRVKNGRRVRTRWLR